MTLRHWEDATRSASWRYQDTVHAQRLRDQIEVPNLSPKAKAAVEQLRTASSRSEGLLRAWQELPGIHGR